MTIRKKESNAILQSLIGGVVPRIGVEHILVGREKESEQIKTELLSVKEGVSVVKFFIGDFGSGKSFILSHIRSTAFSEKFVVADVDFSPERRLYGSDGTALSTYSYLMNNLSTSTRSEGGALPVIIEKWISDVQLSVQSEKGYRDISFDDEDFVKDVEIKIAELLSEMEELIGGFDFAKVLNSYYKGYIEDNDHLMSCSIRWLRGEYKTKGEARQDLGVREIISDKNWYSYLKVITKFITQVGYSGLVVNFDEAINLYKISHAQSREKNYEVLLEIFNEAFQGRSEHLYITFAGTVDFLQDERRGLFSYGALKRRLEGNSFETHEFKDFSQPVIKLAPLKREETSELLNKVNDIHSIHYGYRKTITEQDILNFVSTMYRKPGSEEFLTVGRIVRYFIGALNILHQNSDMKKDSIFKMTESQFHQELEESSLDRFVDFYDNDEE